MLSSYIGYSELDFSKVVPFLQDPLVAVGLALTLTFGFFQVFIKTGVIPPLPKTASGNIVMRLLTYAFVLALSTVVLGFLLKAYSTQKQPQVEKQSVVKDIRELRKRMSRIAWHRLWEEDTRRVCEGTIVQSNEINALADEFNRHTKEHDFNGASSADQRMRLVMHSVYLPYLKPQSTDTKAESLQEIFNSIAYSCQELVAISNEMRQDYTLDPNDEARLNQILNNVEPYETMFKFLDLMMFNGEETEILRVSRLLQKQFNLDSPTPPTKSFRDAQTILFREIDALAEIANRYN